ncbi:MAG: hypothetical protein VXB67_13005, partial [Deltaproteobacteria bacterium]
FVSKDCCWIGRMKADGLKLSYGSHPSSGLRPASPQRRKQRTKGLLHAKTIKFANEINALKTLAQLGEGGPS